MESGSDKSVSCLDVDNKITEHGDVVVDTVALPSTSTSSSEQSRKNDDFGVELDGFETYATSEDQKRMDLEGLINRSQSILKRAREAGDTTPESEENCDNKEWITVSRERKGKKEPKIESKVVPKEELEVYITSKEPLPKQFAMARFLSECKINSISRVKYISPFKVRIEFENEQSAEQLYTCENIIKKGWLVYKPMEINHCYGIIRDVDGELSDEEIKSKLKCLGTIISVKRLMRRDRSDGKWVPSEVVRLGFKGSMLPTHVYVEGMRIKVEPYVYPVSQCYKCWKIGHYVRNCPSKDNVCPKCAGSHDSCATTSFTCVNCDGDHMAMSKTCPVFIKEKRLRELMSEFNCTYRKSLSLYVVESPQPEPRNVVEHTQEPKVKRNFTPVAEQSLYTPLFSDICSGTAKPTKETIKLKKVLTETQPRPPGSTTKKLQDRKQKREKVTERDNFPEMDWNDILSENEECKSENSEDENDCKATFSELLNRIKEVLFIKEFSFKDKVGAIVRVCVEWIIIFAAGIITDWPCMKLLMDLVKNGWFR